MKCSEMSRLLHAYLAGSLEPGQAEEVEGHLQDCARCQGELALEREISVGLERFPALEPSESFVAGTLGRLAGPSPRAAAKAPANGLARLVFDGLVPAFVLAGLFLLFGLSGSPRVHLARPQGMEAAIPKIAAPPPTDIPIRQGELYRWLEKQSQ